jgi:hypothetical protein
LHKYRFWDDDSVGVADLSNAYVYSPHDDNNVIPARLPCQAGAALPIHASTGRSKVIDLASHGADLPESLDPAAGGRDVGAAGGLIDDR